MSGPKLKQLACAAVIGFPLLAGGCTSAGEPQVVPPKPGTSAYADYLIGQFAVRHRTMGVAADHLSAVHDVEGLPQAVGSNLDRQLFTILAGEGKIKEAAQIAPTLTDKNLMAQVVLVIDDVVQGQYQEAREKAQDMSSRGLGTFVKPLLLAWAVVETDGIDAALKSLAPLEKQEGLSALYHLHVAMLNDFAGNKEEAEVNYKAAANGPGGISLRLAELYGTFLVKQGRLADATKVYLDYFTEHPESLYIQAMSDDLESGALATRPALTVGDGMAETLFGLASSLRSDSTRQAGLIMGRLALHAKPDFPIARILVAEILESDERLADANAVYASIPAENPFSWSARLRMSLNMDDLGEEDQAIAILDKMVAQHPDRLEAWVTLGDVLRHHERYERAQKVYGHALEMIGDNVARHHWDLFYSRAITLERLKRWDEAEPLFLKALELEPKQPFVLNYLGYSWIEFGRNFERAQEMIEEAVAQRPRDGYIVDSLGWVLFRLGEYEKAVPHMERAVELQPSDPVINDHLGDVYWKVGRNREARFQWRRAKSLDPEPDVLEKIEQKLERGLED